MEKHHQLIATNSGYRRTLSFGLTCLVYHATTRFCERVYTYKNDPLGKTTGQMVGAARSARQNIVEASARAGTSKETELRLLDVAKASLEELRGDYEAFLVDNNMTLWSVNDECYKTTMEIPFDKFTATDDASHAFSLHIIAMRQRFATWLENENQFVAANAIFITARRAQFLLLKQMEQIGDSVLNEGGFRERMTHLRLEQREPSQPQPPVCHVCGKPMKQRTAKSGANAGKPFWACTGYPECKTIVAIEEKKAGD